MNPSIPLETFLPPDDFSQYHFLATKDWNGLNAGVFFIRVHQWSVDFMTEVMAEPLLKPNVEHLYLEQGDMARVLEKANYSDHVVYQPRVWYNTYSKGIADAKDPEVVLGDMQVHFPGLSNKRESMGYWLDKVEKTETWTVALNETYYPGQVEEFWELLRKFRLMITDLAEAAKSAPKHAERLSIFEVEHDYLQRLVREEPFETEKLMNALVRSVEALEVPNKMPVTEQATQLPSPSLHVLTVPT